jgi:hypothetical protein
MSFDAVELAIVDRITERLGALVRKVYTAAELSQVEEESQLTPSCSVVYNGYGPISSTNGSLGKVQSIDKAWLVVVSVRHATATRTQAGARASAAPIVDGVLQAMLGWRPPIEGEMPFQLAEAPGAAFTDAGFAYYPIAFTNRRTYRGID